MVYSAELANDRLKDFYFIREEVYDKRGKEKDTKGANFNFTLAENL